MLLSCEVEASKKLISPDTKTTTNKQKTKKNKKTKENKTIIYKSSYVNG